MEMHMSANPAKTGLADMWLDWTLDQVLPKSSETTTISQRFTPLLLFMSLTVPYYAAKCCIHELSAVWRHQVFNKRNKVNVFSHHFLLSFLCVGKQAEEEISI